MLLMRGVTGELTLKLKVNDFEVDQGKTLLCGRKVDSSFETPRSFSKPPFQELIRFVPKYQSATVPIYLQTQSLMKDEEAHLSS